MKRIFKWIGNGALILLILAALLLYQTGRMVLGSNVAFSGWSQAFTLIPGLTGTYFLRAFYRLVLSRCEAGCCICFGTVFSHPTVEIGKDVYVGLFCTIGDVTLEDDVRISSHLPVINGGRQHGTDRFDIPVREQPGSWTRVTIGRDTWIGERSTIMANGGKQCVIGAGSVYTRPIPDYAIAVGCPAQVVRFRDGKGGQDRDPVQALDNALSKTRSY
jgi:acetyltransferase-like isoleucine patch superfamily enzyme